MSSENNQNETSVKVLFEDDEELKRVIEEQVATDSGLKDLVVGYIGEKLKPENGEVTMEMCVDVFTNEFPEFLLLLAQENFLRGYSQALNDMEAAENEQKTK